MATIPELLDGHITLEVECLDRLYLNGYIGKLATGSGLSMFMRFQLGMPVPSPVVLGRVSERFREAVKAQAERDDIPVHQFQHKERKDDIANNFRRQRPVRDGIVFIGVAQEKAQAFNGKKVNGQFEFNRDKRSTSTITTSTSMTKTSVCCSSKSAAMLRGVRSCA
jgi:hypothetical protein